MGKRVLITGGNKGIGLALTDKFVKNGYDVIVLGRDFQNFELSDVLKVQFDLNEIERIKEIAEEIGDIDILINNAGIDRKRPYYDYPKEDVERILNVNLKAPIALINAYLPSFIKRHEGRVVNVASQAAEVGHTDIWYGITKAGLVNVTKSFASIVGGEGVVINAVAPGPVATEMIENTPFAKRYELLKVRTYLNRVAQPEEVAEVVYWLATDAPSYVNGETIDINNGAQRVKG